MLRKTSLALILMSTISLISCNENYDYLIKPGEADVYIIMGQSNASGYTQYSYLKAKDNSLYMQYKKPNNEVLVSYLADQNSNGCFAPIKFGYGCDRNSFGPEIGIADTIKNSSQRKYIIKSAFGGTNLNSQWLDSGNRGILYTQSIERIKEKLNYLIKRNVTPYVKGVFWMQGESDSFNETDVANYKQNTINLVSFIREDLSSYIQDHMNFVDATIKTIDNVWPHGEEINQAKIEVSQTLDNCYCVLTNNENSSALSLTTKNMCDETNDAAHYDSLSMIKLGQDAGNYLLK